MTKVHALCLGSVSVALLLSFTVFSYGQNETPAQAKAAAKVEEEHDKAVRGGYEDQYKDAMEKNGGTRTKEVYHEQEAIRNGERAGSGHDGDNSQPGLNGQEGTH